MIKKTYISIALLLLFYPLYSQTKSDSTSLSKNDSIPEIVLPNSSDSEGSILGKFFKEKQNIERTPAQIIKDAKKIESDANKKAKEIKYDANIKAKEIEKAANKKAKEIEKAANKKAKKITSRAKVRQEFLNENSLLVLAVFTLLTIIGLLMYVFQVWTWRKQIDNNSISLPEVLRNDIDQVLKKIPLLTTAEELENYEKETIISLTNIKQGIPEAVKLIGQKIIELETKADKNYSEGLKLLREQLEIKEEKLGEKYNFNLKKKYILEVLKIEEKLLFEEKNNESDELKNILKGLLASINKFLKKEDVRELSFSKGQHLDQMFISEFEKVEDIETDNSHLDQTICETVESGYWVDSNGSRLIIKRAKVSIYIPKENDKHDDKIVE